MPASPIAFRLRERARAASAHAAPTGSTFVQHLQRMQHLTRIET